MKWLLFLKGDLKFWILTSLECNLSRISWNRKRSYTKVPHKSSQPYPEPSIQKWGKENKKENLSKCCKCIYHSPMMSDAEYIWSSIQSYLVLRGICRTGLNWTLDLVLIVEISITWFSTKERFQMKERLKKAEPNLSIFCQTAPPLAEGWCSRPLKIGIYSKFKTLYLMKSELIWFRKASVYRIIRWCCFWCLLWLSIPQKSKPQSPPQSPICKVRNK